MLALKDSAPSFELYDQDNNVVTLDQFKGQYVVLYFYPKDNTPGCTREAIAFSALKSDFEALNTVILGVSKDSVKSHQNFCKKQGLSITLLSDESTHMIQDYAVWQEKKNYGKTYMGIVRTSFLIDPDGKILKIWEKVKVDGHAEAVLTYLNTLS